MQIVMYISFVNVSGSNTYDVLETLPWKKECCLLERTSFDVDAYVGKC